MQVIYRTQEEVLEELKKGLPVKKKTNKCKKAIIITHV